MTSLRLALRTLLRAPGFTTVVVLSLGLGVGACTVVFSLIKSVYGYEAPYPEADRIVQIGSTAKPTTLQRVDIVPIDRVRAWMNVDFHALESFQVRTLTPLVLDLGEPERIEGELVSGGYFELLGVPALMGRWLNAADDDPRAELAAVISEAFWKDKLGSQRSVLGSVIKVSGDLYTIVGVMPERFEPEPRIWVSASDRMTRGTIIAWDLIARLRTGATLSQASTEVRELAAAEIAADSTLYGGYGAIAYPFADARESIATSTLWVLIVTAVGILLLVVANLVNLFLVRGAQRGRSAGIRLTLGASAWQLSRGVLIESVVLGLAGAALALVVALWWSGLARVWAGVAPNPHGAVIDPLTIAFAPVLSLAVAALVGSEPLRHILRLDLRGLMTGTTTTSLGRRERVTRNVMVGTQVGLAMTFACIGVVLSFAYTRFGEFDIGYDAERVAVAVPEWDAARIGPDAQPSTMSEPLRRIAASPDIESAALWRQINQRFPPKLEWDPVFDGGVPGGLGLGDQSLVRYSEVGGDFFKTLGIPIIAGRDFGETDGLASPAVGIISEDGAKAWWPGQDPIGRQLKIGEMGEWITVVGVAGNTARLEEMGRDFARGVIIGTRQFMPFLYRPMTQSQTPPEGWVMQGDMMGLDGVVVAARGKADPVAALQTIKAEVSGTLPELSLQYAGVLQDWQMGGYGRDLNLYRALLVSLAGAAFFLSLFGVAGIVADGVVRRTREIGIRKALGARAGDVTTALAREGLVTAVCGVSAGTVLVFALSEIVSRIKSINSLLIGGSLADWRALVGVGIAVLATTIVASCLCTIRANRMEPVVALRSE